MICPHCKKPFKIGRTPEAERRARKLLSQGFNLREVERTMQNEGFTISVTTVMKVKQEMEKPK